MEYEIAISCGVFDCLHKGHIELLQMLKNKGKRVIIFVHDDKSTFLNKGKFPVQKLEQRVFNLIDCELVNEIIIVNDKNPLSRLTKFIAGKDKKDMVYIRGDDWKDAPAIKELIEMGIKVIFKPYTQGVSSTEIRNEVLKR
jgi:cytidyltransferase-like protein